MWVVGAVIVLILVIAWRLKPKPVPGVYIPWPMKGVTGNLTQLQKNFDNFHVWKLEAGKKAVKNGKKIFQVSIPGVNFLDVTDPELVEIMLSDPDTFIKGSRGVSAFHAVLGQGIFNSNGTAWKDARKRASHMFSTRALRDQMEHVFIDHGHSLIEILEKHADEKKSIDMQDIFFRYTMDSISEVAFGVPLRSLDQDEVPFAAHFDRAQEIVTERFFSAVPWQLKRLFNVAPEPEMAKCVKSMKEFCENLIKERRKLHPDALDTRNDVLSLFMKSKQKKGEKYTDEECIDEVMNFMIAGRDTTACALTWLFYELTRNPDVLAKIRQEITLHVGNDRDPTEASTKKMVYTDAVFSEVTRLWPPVPSDGKMTAAPVILDGCHIPAGTLVGFAPYMLNRLQCNWGADSEEFKPDRWLEHDGKEELQLKKVSDFKFISFNAGPRLCLGKPMAFFEAKTLLSMILNKFDFELEDSDYEPVPLTTIILKMKQPGLRMKVTRRN